MSSEEFVVSYHQFVSGHFGKTNRSGKLIFADVHRAKLWGWFWLRDNGFPSLQYRLKHDPSWVDAGTKTRSGRVLGWRVFTNIHMTTESRSNAEG
jgi:hypothetical protein